MVGEALSICGLALDIVGVIIIFFFGLAPAISKSGGVYLTFGVDNEEVRKAKRYDRISKVALVIVIIGFALQAVGEALD